MVVDYMLRDAAVCGDEETFRQLVTVGEDANTVIGALILGASSFDEFDACRAQVSAPGRLSILSFLLENRCLSLYNLNAPHSALKGLTPLGMATYLNRFNFVTTLLEKGDSLVLVDGVDSQGATPIMYAVRDGHVEVSRYLIRQGARVTSVDWQNRSVLFYSRASPQCLWDCELSLRLQRAQSLLSHGRKRKMKLTLQHDAGEYSTLACVYQRHTAYPLSPSTLKLLVQRLVISVTSSDLSAVNSLLFPSQDSQSSDAAVPVLVNFPDENGWSPIHHCVASPRPSTAVLDVLFLAGADLGMYTTDNTMTPLHVLARFVGSGSTVSFRLYAFIVHLVRDLGAPLGAIDQNGETCIHVAARYGRCADILMAFLECDTNDVVARIRNNDGQTAYEVAKPEFRSIFEQDDGASIRPGSAASSRTIRPSYSSSSLGTTHSSSSSGSDSLEDEDEFSSVNEGQFPRPISHERESLRALLMNPKEAKRLLDSLEYLSEQLRKQKNSKTHGFSKGKAKQSADLADVEERLHYTRQNSSELLEHCRRLIDMETEGLHAAQDVHAILEQLIKRLNQRAQADEEEQRARTPSISSYRRLSETPSLVASASSVSLTSLADFAALVTPTGSPRASVGVDGTPKQPNGYKQREGVGVRVPAEGTPDVSEQTEIDFASVLSAGSVTRQRRSRIFALGDAETSEFQLSDTSPTTQLEDGINVFSVPPARVPEVQDIIVQDEQQPPAIDQAAAADPIPSAKKRESWSWLDPYVRRANSDILKEHLVNLLEIEKMLFGAEDREREEIPSPGSVSDENDDAWNWREGVDALSDHGDDESADSTMDSTAEEKQIGNFLDMFGAEDEEERPFLDLFDALPSEMDNEDEETDCYSKRASTVKPARARKDVALKRHSVSALDILGIAKMEMYAIEEAMVTASRSIETALRYISQAEHLTSEIFQKVERAMQASRIAAPGILEESLAFPFPPSSHPPRLKHRPLEQSLLSSSQSHSAPSSSLSPFASSPRPSPMSAKPDSRSQSSAVALALADNIKWLHHLLERKIPIWLDATAYDVDKVDSWVGIVQAVVRNMRRTKL